MAPDRRRIPAAKVKAVVRRTRKARAPAAPHRAPIQAPADSTDKRRTASQIAGNSRDGQAAADLAAASSAVEAAGSAADSNNSD